MRLQQQLRQAWGKPWVSLAVVAGLTWAVSQGAAYWLNRSDARELRRLAQPGDILMISSETCVYCDRARRWLDDSGISYRECLIEQDEVCTRTYQALLTPGTPTFVVRGKRVIGMDKGRILAALQSSPVAP